MAEVVLAVLNRPEDAAGLLDAGTRLLQIGGGGRLLALAVRIAPLSTIMPTEEVLTADREAELRAGQQQWAERLKAIVDRQPPSAVPAVCIDWIDTEGDAAAIVALHGQEADAIVLAHPADGTSERQRECMHAALFDTECTVLVMPPEYAQPFGRVVAIAWKDGGCAANSVRAAIPLLRQADAVHVICADADPVMPPIMAAHDIAAELHAVADGEAPTAERLLDAAHGVGADLLVMGAFTLGEWHERLFGGVTAAMLADADLPLLMRH